MESPILSYFLDAYKDEPIKYRMKASYGISGMFAGFIFIFIAFISHIFLMAPKVHLVFGDIIALTFSLIGAFVLKRGDLAKGGILYLSGTMVFIGVVTFNIDGASHVLRLFQTLAVSMIAILVFSLMATKKWQMYAACAVSLIIISCHIHMLANSPYITFAEQNGMITSVVLLLAQGFFFVAVLLNFGLSNALLKSNDQKTEVIDQQKTVLEARAKRLEEINEDLKIFAYSMSHDLKEPVRMVSSFSQLLQKEIAKENTNMDLMNEYSQFAYNGSIKMNTLINNLLSYIQLNAAPRESKWIDISRLIMSITQINLSLLIRENQAEVNLKGEKMVYADKQQLEQILQNLISNSIKYSSPERKPIINIDVRHDDNGVHIDVSDNGAGIAKEQQHKIFEAFQRLDNNSAYQGLGIGLAICRKVMENHKGSISLSSEVGKGTMFHLFFPRETKVMQLPNNNTKKSPPFIPKAL